MKEKTWGQLLRDLRKAAKLKQEYCAEKVGCTKRTWSRWENDESVPTSDAHLKGIEELFSGS